MLQPYDLYPCDELRRFELYEVQQFLHQLLEDFLAKVLCTYQSRNNWVAIVRPILILSFSHSKAYTYVLSMMYQCQIIQLQNPCSKQQNKFRRLWLHS
jgi:general stress protein CsbA